MMPIAIKEAVAVEGKYDAARLRTVVDTVVVETGGFRLFRDREKMTLLRTLAQTRGLIVLTDSDAAGFVIRDRLAGALPKAQLKHAYIPEIHGKEKRKRAPSAEGLIGVEGVDEACLLEALLRAGATPNDGTAERVCVPFLTKARLYEDGLVGGTNSAVYRAALLCELQLPQYLSVNRMIEVLNAVLTEEQYRVLLKKVTKQT